MQTLADIKALLAARGLAPRRSLGQNFLIDKNLVTKFADAALAHGSRLVLEVGPGTGALTEALLARGCRVVAIELDAGLASLLRDRTPDLIALAPGASLRVVEGDALAGPGGRRLNPEAAALLAGEPFSLIANLPYNAATPLMMALLIEHPECRRLAVTIQREVADRLVAKPNTPDYGTLGIVAQSLARVERIADLPPECFWPRPEVTSAMVVLDRLPEPLTPDPRGLAKFCQRLFSARRRQLGSTLGRSLDWPPGIRPEQRPAELSPAQIIALARLVAPADSGDSAPSTVDDASKPG